MVMCYRLSTRPDDQNTLTCQTTNTDDAPRDPIIGTLTSPIHTIDITEHDKNSVENTPTESSDRKGAFLRVDVNNTSKNVPKSSLRVKDMQQQNYATPKILYKEPRQQRRKPNLITREKNREGNTGAHIPTKYKFREMEEFLDTNAEPKHRVANLAEHHMDKLFQKVIKYQE